MTLVLAVISWAWHPKRRQPNQKETSGTACIGKLVQSQGRHPQNKEAAHTGGENTCRPHKWPSIRVQNECGLWALCPPLVRLLESSEGGRWPTWVGPQSTHLTFYPVSWISLLFFNLYFSIVLLFPPIPFKPVLFYLCIYIFLLCLKSCLP